MSDPRCVEIEAPAKINLRLRVLGRRPSGFHDIETLFQAVGLFDRLRVRRREPPGVTIAVEGADVGPAAQNLAVRAARAYLARAGLAVGIHIDLLKSIPVGAGFGGGSADAAAVLTALDLLFGGALPPPATNEIAVDLGSDVPFFLCGSSYALGEGRGERLTPLEALPGTGVLLGVPRVHVATGPAYELLAASRASRLVARPLAGELVAPPRSWAEVAAVAVNDFESVVAEAYPEVGSVLEAVRAAAPAAAHLSGSGGGVFGLFESVEATVRAAADLDARMLGAHFLAAPTLTALPRPRRGEG